MRGKIPVGQAAFLVIVGTALSPGCVIQHGEFTNASYRKVVTEKGVPSVRFEADFKIEGAASEQLVYEVTLLDRDGRPLRSQNGRYQNKSGHVTAGRTLLAQGGRGVYQKETVVLPISEVEAQERRPPRFARFAIYDVSGGLIVQHDIPFKLRPTDYERAREIEDYFAEEEADSREARFDARERRARTGESRDRGEEQADNAEPPERPRREARSTPRARDRDGGERASANADGELSDSNTEDANTPEARRNRARIARTSERADPAPNARPNPDDRFSARDPAYPPITDESGGDAPSQPTSASSSPQATAAPNYDVPVKSLQPLSARPSTSENRATLDESSSYGRRRALGPTGSQLSNAESSRTNTELAETNVENPPKEQFRTHSVRKGETLSGIAQDLLGSATRWPEIYRLNEGLLDGPDFIPMDTVLRIPPK